MITVIVTVKRGAISDRMLTQGVQVVVEGILTAWGSLVRAARTEVEGGGRRRERSHLVADLQETEHQKRHERCPTAKRIPFRQEQIPGQT